MDWTKFKAFADDKLNIGAIMISCFDSVENIVGKGENAGYQHFLLFPQSFQKASFVGVVKSQDCVVKKNRVENIEDNKEEEAACQSFTTMFSKASSTG